MKKIWLLYLTLTIGILFPVMANAVQQNDANETQKIQYDESSDLNPLSFNKTTIGDFKNKKEYDYQEVAAADNWWTQFKTWMGRVWTEFWTWLFGDFKGNTFLTIIIEVLPYLIIGVIMGFIIWIFYKINPGAFLFRKIENPTIVFSEEEDIIRNSDIEELIEQALTQKDYRLAVRYYYLRLLKNLYKTEIIKYEADKTNSDYNKEISSCDIRSGFEKATLLYDYIWYGSFEVSETDFLKAQKTFNSLQRLIQAGHE